MVASTFYMAGIETSPNFKYSDIYTAILYLFFFFFFTMAEQLSDSQAWYKTICPEL